VTDIQETGRNNVIKLQDLLTLYERSSDVMEQQPYDDKSIIRYLLEDLSEEEQSRLEAKYFSDKEFFEYTEMVEEKLIDDYLQKKLSNTDEEKFERRYLTFVRKRKEVEFTKCLMDVVSLESMATENSGG
jgi:hypothetical protein